MKAPSPPLASSSGARADLRGETSRERSEVPASSPKEKRELALTIREEGTDPRDLKKRRLDPEDRSKGAEAAGCSFTFRHTKDTSVLEDKWSLAYLMRHLVPAGPLVPPMRELQQRDGYLNFSHHVGQLVSAVNQTFVGYEELLKNIPTLREVGDTKVAFEAMKQKLDEAEAENTRLQGKLADYSLDMGILKRQKADLTMERQLSEGRVKELLSEVRDLRIKNDELEADKAVAERRGARVGKKDMWDAFNSILLKVKDKFERKKEMASAKIAVQEIQANVDLLEDIIAGTVVDLAKERADLENNEMPEALKELNVKAVSDFSISKLDLPQLSEVSVKPLQVDSDLITQPAVDQFEGDVILAATGGTREVEKSGALPDVESEGPKETRGRRSSAGR
ncbi:hypothetical protein V5N11_028666 [Cardamine amara subsp. amara]|uniref:Translin-associated factor X-interacting protein 1 N-terminal domain-containing protein n=1 Tax=Cardamine amara subsp. amara TaxID=228776 RepID=A0ABD0Z1N6_CARAN